MLNFPVFFRSLDTEKETSIILLICAPQTAYQIFFSEEQCNVYCRLSWVEKVIKQLKANEVWKNEETWFFYRRRSGSWTNHPQTQHNRGEVTSFLCADEFWCW